MIGYFNIDNVLDLPVELFKLGGARANALVMRIKGDMLSSGFQAATINRRLYAIRSLTKMGRLLGLINWSVEVGGVKSEKYRQTVTLSIPQVQSLLAHGHHVRDRVLVALMYYCALRREEARTVLWSDVDLISGVVWIKGKGMIGKQPITLPVHLKSMLIEYRTQKIPNRPQLFPGRDKNGFLAPREVARVISDIGESVGIRGLHPHAIRHASITHVGDVTNGNIRAMKQQGRHSNVNTTMIYDDNRVNLAGAACERLSEMILK
jgi:integrase/recombinase XerC